MIPTAARAARSKPSPRPSATTTAHASIAEASATPGYLSVTRSWQPGDVLAWTFELTPRWVYPHPRIDAVRGCTAIERGPLVYCFKQVDQADGTDLDDLALVAGSALIDQPATLPETSWSRHMYRVLNPAP